MPTATNRAGPIVSAAMVVIGRHFSGFSVVEGNAIDRSRPSDRPRGLIRTGLNVGI